MNRRVKLNKKGFMLAEVIVVSVVIITVLVTLFTALNRLISAYDIRSTYYDIDAAYLTVEVNDILVSNGYINDIINNGVSDDLYFIMHDVGLRDEFDYLQSLFNMYEEYNIICYFSLYTSSDITTLKNKSTHQTFKDYTDYLSGNLVFDDDYTYVIIIEMCEKENTDSCKHYTLKVR